MKTIAPGIHRLSHGVSNYYLVEEERRLVMVDAGVAGDWSGLLAAVKTLGRSPSDLTAVLLTHAHSDHTGVAERARTEARSTIWVHEADAAVGKGAPPPANETGIGARLRHLEAWRTIFGLMLHGGLSIVPILELSTFVDGQSLELPGHPRVVHMPGHTPGSSALFFPQLRAVFTGDGIVTRNPLTGRRGPQIMPQSFNRSSAQALASLSQVENLAADWVLPGHGEPWDEGAAKAVQVARAAGYS